MNKFYRLNLGLLCILAVVRYAYPRVMDRADAQPVTAGQEPMAYLVEVPETNGQADEGLPEEEVGQGQDETVAQAEEAGIAESSPVDETSPLDEPEVAPVPTLTSRTMLFSMADTTVFSDKKHRVYSVPGSYLENFPDVQDVQYPAARKWGIQPMANRTELARHKKDLVYIGANPYIHLDERMSNSVPYLVPRAADLLIHLGRAFADSLYAKRIPLHKFVVSSVLRTEADVARLSRGNVNATERSCHMFGTTIDINYNRYYTVSSPDGPARREVRNDSLKMVLSEVLRDARREGRCYVRYERLQPCFHITVR